MIKQPGIYLIYGIIFSNKKKKPLKGVKRCTDTVRLVLLTGHSGCYVEKGLITINQAGISQKFMNFPHRTAVVNQKENECKS